MSGNRTHRCWGIRLGGGDSGRARGCVGGARWQWGGGGGVDRMVVWLTRRRACNGEAEEVVGGGSGETYDARLKMPAGVALSG
jgi:hypothetical protein